MELSKEVIEQAKLTEDQVKLVSEYSKQFINDQIAVVKKEFEGKANENAERIIAGAASLVEQKTGIKRNEGEKQGEYLNRASTLYFSNKEAELDNAKKEYESKIKNANPEALSKAYEELKAKNNEILQKYADYDQLKEKAVKADEYGQQLSTLKIDLAFNGVKPQFPDGANQYEVSAKWDAFKKSILEKNIIELVDGVPMAIDKENQYKQTKLADLVAKDSELKTIQGAKSNNGFLGAKEKDFQTIEGVPFQLPKNATSKEISETIKNFLVKDQKLDVISQKYASEFKRLFEIVKSKTA